MSNGCEDCGAFPCIGIIHSGGVNPTRDRKYWNKLMNSPFGCGGWKSPSALKEESK